MVQIEKRPGRMHVPTPVMRAAILAATAAPSVHNTQPWRFRLTDNGVDVLVDRARQLRALDPQGREMYISVGAAVFNLRVALVASGWAVDVVLGPADPDPDLAARLTILGPTGVTPAARALAAAIARRHTNRRPFTDTPLPDRLWTELAGAAGAEGARLYRTDAAIRDAVLSLTRTAENRLRGDARYRAELAAWTTPGGPGRRDGVPRQALGPRDESLALPLRDLSVGHGLPTTTVQFEQEPTIALLFTHGDSHASWLRAGTALQRVWLTATARGLAATPLSQVTEIPALRALLTDSASDDVVQTVLRVGFPSRPASPTPRRAVADVLVDSRS